MIKRIITLIVFIPVVLLTFLQFPIAIIQWIINGKIPKSLLQIFMER